MDKADYIQKANALLEDRQAYLPCNDEPMRKLVTQLDKTLADMQTSKAIDKSVRLAIKPVDAAAPRFYGLPKVHKAGVPLRPIVSLRGAPTFNLAKWMFRNLRSLTSDAGTTVCSATQFLERIKGMRLTEDEVMVSFDVTSLFTSIPQDLAVETVSELLESQYDETGVTIKRRHLVQLLRFCLKTYFTFEASNTGLRSDTVEVIVNVLDINDFAPEIFLIDSTDEADGGGEAIVVPENTDATLILTLRVRDRDLGDNGEVSCALDDSNDVGYKFRLNREPNPALYTLHTRRRFDAEVEPAIVLNITCWDSGSPRQSTSRRIVVRIGDENEYSPIFSKQEYTATVVENARANQPVLQVLATDRDHSAQLTYSLKGDGERYFKIDPDTGLITTIGGGEHESSRLDREMTPAVTFDVLVQDVRPPSGLQDEDKRLRSFNETAVRELVINTAQATVRIKVLDENDNEPTFTSVGPFYLPENHSKYTKVNGHLNAVDPDEGLNGTVRLMCLVRVSAEETSDAKASPSLEDDASPPSSSCLPPTRSNRHGDKEVGVPKLGRRASWHGGQANGIGRWCWTPINSITKTTTGVICSETDKRHQG
nr:unnamed protein product [Spirometra erinaceieuropaei]